MAVWIYAYGKNGLPVVDDNHDVQILNLLNNIELNELKILETIKPSHYVRQYYTENKTMLEYHFKAMTEIEYKKYLISIGLPYIDVKNIIDHFIIEGEKRENEKILKYNLICDEFKKGKLKSKWEVCENGSFINRICSDESIVDGIKIALKNDLVWITGPFAVFSKYFYFLNDLSKDYRDYYHSYFKNILKAFKSDFILYAHEWSGLDDEDNLKFNFDELKDSSNWELTSSKTLDSMDRFYYEEL